MTVLLRTTWYRDGVDRDPKAKRIAHEDLANLQKALIRELDKQDQIHQRLLKIKDTLEEYSWKIPARMRTTIQQELDTLLDLIVQKE